LQGMGKSYCFSWESNHKQNFITRGKFRHFSLKFCSTFSKLLASKSYCLVFDALGTRTKDTNQFYSNLFLCVSKIEMQTNTTI